MSRIGKKPVAIPSGVTVEVKGSHVVVKGPKGELSLTLLPEVTIKVEPFDGACTERPPVGRASSRSAQGKGDQIIIERKNDEREARSRHGLTRALLANMVQGVHKGFEKKLEIIGVGYKAKASGKSVELSLGFSHPVNYKAPDGVEIQNDPDNKQILVVSGINKERVGQVAADIRSYRKPEPYKGKGIRYIDEYVQRKVGKTAAKAA